MAQEPMVQVRLGETLAYGDGTVNVCAEMTRIQAELLARYGPDCAVVVTDEPGMFTLGFLVYTPNPWPDGTNVPANAFEG